MQDAGEGGGLLPRDVIHGVNGTVVRTLGDLPRAATVRCHNSRVAARNSPTCAAYPPNPGCPSIGSLLGTLPGMTDCRLRAAGSVSAFMNSVTSSMTWSEKTTPSSNG